LSYEEIFQRHYDNVLSYLLTTPLDPARAEDLSAETFLTLHTKMGAGLELPPDNAERWLIATAKNHLRNEKKRIARLHKAGFSGILSHPQLRLAEDEERLKEYIGSLPATSIEDIEFQTDFDRAIRALPSVDRDAFILTELRGLTSEEAAPLLDCSDRQVRYLRERATARLAEALN
jgi:RNA polymerase sigma factor (sigma-70 family)